MSEVVLPELGLKRPRRLRTTMARTLFVLDVALTLGVWPLALWLARHDLRGVFAVPADMRGIVYPLLDLLLLYAMGLYRREVLVEKRHALVRVPLVVAMGAALSWLLCALPAMIWPSAFPIRGFDDEALMLWLAVVAFTLCAVSARIALDVLVRRGLMRRRVLIVGAGGRAWDLMHMINKEGVSLNYDLAFLHDPDLGPIDPRLEQDRRARILHVTHRRVLEAARDTAADEIVVAPDDRRGLDLGRLLACKIAGFPVLQYLSFVEQEIRRVDIKRMDLGWLVFSEGFYFGTFDRVLKRIFDLAVSLFMLVLTAPLILFGIVAIRLEGPGPVFYRQDRVTQDGTVFRIMKLRTMRVDAERSGAVWAAERDNRITRAGSFLRRARIDELPQLINILRGEMSFVGPRPERPMFVDELAAQIPLYRQRHMVKAGLTGWAQVNYPYGASVDDARSKLSYDLYYVKNFSIRFDFVILLQTLRVVLWPSGVR